MLYVRDICIVVRGCTVSRRYINVCNCDKFSVVNVYLDHLKFCVVCISGRRYDYCGECSVVSNECDEPTFCLVQTINAHCCEVMYFGRVCFRGELGFLNCNDICICAVNKKFELLGLVFDSVYVDLQYHEIYLTFTAGSVSLCCVCSHVVVFGLYTIPYYSDGIYVVYLIHMTYISTIKMCILCRITTHEYVYRISLIYGALFFYVYIIIIYLLFCIDMYGW